MSIERGRNREAYIDFGVQEREHKRGGNESEDKRDQGSKARQRVAEESVVAQQDGVRLRGGAEKIS